MGVNVVICKDCGLRYSGDIYADCPFCKGTGKVEKRPGSHSGGKEWSWPFGKSKNKTRPEKPDTAVIEPEDTGYYNQQMPKNDSGAQIRPTVGYYPPEEDPAADNPSRIENIDSEEDIQPVEKDSDKDVSGRLNDEIQKLSKTTAIYVDRASGEEIYPTVGWLVSVKGRSYGKSFPLRTGVNRVGRSEDYEVALLEEENINRQSKLEIIYDNYDHEFNAIADNTICCIINSKRVFSNDRITLKKFDEISLGAKRENLFLFIPLCGDEFDWDKYSQDV